MISISDKKQKLLALAKSSARLLLIDNIRDGLFLLLERIHDEVDESVAADVEQLIAGLEEDKKRSLSEDEWGGLKLKAVEYKIIINVLEAVIAIKKEGRRRVAEAGSRIDRDPNADLNDLVDPFGIKFG